MSEIKNEKTKYHINYDFRPGGLNIGEVELVQIGRRYTAGGAVIERHAHFNWFEITVVTKGACEVITNDDGSVKEILCTADLETRNGNPVDGRKIKGTIHWVSAKYAEDITLNLYDKLFTIDNVNDIPEGQTYNDYLNPDSLITVTGAKAEPALSDARDGDKFQFVRMGYFCKDIKHEGVFNRVVGLKDSFAKK